MIVGLWGVMTNLIVRTKAKRLTLEFPIWQDTTSWHTARSSTLEDGNIWVEHGEEHPGRKRHLPGMQSVSLGFRASNGIAS